MKKYIMDFITNKKNLTPVLAKLKKVEKELIDFFIDIAPAVPGHEFDFQYMDFSILEESGGKRLKKNRYLLHNNKVIPETPEHIGYQIYIKGKGKTKGIVDATPYDYMSWKDIVIMVDELHDYLEYLIELVKETLGLTSEELSEKMIAKYNDEYYRGIPLFGM